MISDVPVGVLLSGGVDSSGILSHAAETSNGPLRTFTVGFSEAGATDERPYAKLIAEQYGTEHHAITLSAVAFADFLPNYVWHMEEPVCEPPAIALHAIAKRARDCGVKVLLSGEGGDEAFGGYNTYRNILLIESLKQALGPARGLLQAGLHTVSGVWGGASSYANLVRPALESYYLGRTATPTMHYTELNRRVRGSSTRDDSTRVERRGDPRPLSAGPRAVQPEPHAVRGYQDVVTR